MDKEIQSVDDVIKKITPDRGLGIQFGPTLAGLADNPSDELDHIFEQAIIAQYSKQTPDSRTDEDVWTVFKKSLSAKKIDGYLRPKNLLSSEGFDYKFDHAFKNEKWHVLKPVNMDYAQSATIQNRATKILGETMALEGNPELSTYYILLGEPRNDDHKAAYIKAKNLLHKKIPVKKEIYEEDAAKDLAEYLADYMEKHGVIQEPSTT